MSEESTSIDELDEDREISEDWRVRFLELFSLSLNVSLSAQGAGVSRVWAYKERQKNPEFAAKWDDAKIAAIERLEGVAFKRAQESSDLLVIFLLKAHKPDVYRERFESTTMAVNIDWNQLTDEQLQRIAAGEKPTRVLEDRRS